MIISIDFDGTIVQNKFPDIGELIPDAKKSINYLYEGGHKIIINTCREGQQLLDAINFLLHNDIMFHRVNDNLPENTEKYGSNSRKVYAHRYIDDRNIGGFPGWPACIDDIEKTEAEYLVSLAPNGDSQIPNPKTCPPFGGSQIPNQNETPPPPHIRRNIYFL